jgi:hypothetical protein
MGQRGWIGMTWPTRYGGHARSALERYVVLEEMLAHGAPVSAHWIADRQSGPLLLRSGTERQRLEILPRIARGECFVCIGLSEPDVGSDLASVRTRAVAVDGGYRINGAKLWTTNAHRSHYMILFCRTGETGERHQGTSQFLLDMKTPGIEVRPVAALTGEHHFNEVVFKDVFVAADCVIGTIGEGWQQVTSELANERSGPERFLSSFTLLVELVRALGHSPSDHATACHRPPRRAYRRASPDVPIRGRNAANRIRPDAAGGDRERPRSPARAGDTGNLAPAGRRRADVAVDRKFLGRTGLYRAARSFFLAPRRNARDLTRHHRTRPRVALGPPCSSARLSPSPDAARQSIGVGAPHSLLQAGSSTRVATPGRPEQSKPAQSLL